jgi:hypothetical protein
MQIYIYLHIFTYIYIYLHIFTYIYILMCRYGMDEVTGYPRMLFDQEPDRAARVMADFPDTDVTYLAGMLDVKNCAMKGHYGCRDTVLPKTCPDMLQGDHRLDRMIKWYGYLRHYYGKKVHRLVLQKHVGHNMRFMMHSEAGKCALFGACKNAEVRQLIYGVEADGNREIVNQDGKLLPSEVHPPSPSPVKDPTQRHTRPTHRPTSGPTLESSGLAQAHKPTHRPTHRPTRDRDNTWTAPPTFMEDDDDEYAGYGDRRRRALGSIVGTHKGDGDNDDVNDDINDDSNAGNDGNDGDDGNDGVVEVQSVLAEDSPSSRGTPSAPAPAAYGGLSYGGLSYVDKDIIVL